MFLTFLNYLLDLGFQFLGKKNQTVIGLFHKVQLKEKQQYQVGEVKCRRKTLRLENRTVDTPTLSVCGQAQCLEHEIYILFPYSFLIVIQVAVTVFRWWPHAFYLIIDKGNICRWFQPKLSLFKQRCRVVYLLWVTEPISISEFTCCVMHM